MCVDLRSCHESLPVSLPVWSGLLVFKQRSDLTISVVSEQKTCLLT